MKIHIEIGKPGLSRDDSRVNGRSIYFLLCHQKGRIKSNQKYCYTRCDLYYDTGYNICIIINISFKITK